MRYIHSIFVINVAKLVTKNTIPQFTGTHSCLMFNLAPGNSCYSDPLPWHRVSKLTLCWNCKTHSHNPNEPGENQVGHCETIPRRVVEEIIASTSVVDEDHHCYGQASKGIQWPDSSGLPCFDLHQQR